MAGRSLSLYSTPSQQTQSHPQPVWSQPPQGSVRRVHVHSVQARVVCLTSDLRLMAYDDIARGTAHRLE